MKLSISMNKNERLLGWIYLVFSLFILPILLDLLNGLVGNFLSNGILTMITMVLNFAAIVLIFQRFLTNSVKAAANRLWRVLGFTSLGLVLYYGASFLITIVIRQFYPSFANINDATVMALFTQYPALMTIITVLLVPVTEEALYRGLFFLGFQKKYRVLAYILSTLIFAGIHVIGYIGSTDAVTLCLCLVQYLPAGILLAWVYERADTIAAPIFMHIIINLIGTSVMR